MSFGTLGGGNEADNLLHYSRHLDEATSIRATMYEPPFLFTFLDNTTNSQTIHHKPIPDNLIRHLPHILNSSPLCLNTTLAGTGILSLLVLLVRLSKFDSSLRE